MTDIDRNRFIATGTVLVCALMMVVLLTGCAAKETVTVATVVAPPKPPLPRECDPAGHVAFPKVTAKKGGTPVENLEQAFVSAKSKDSKNAAREQLCYEGVKPEFAEAALPAPEVKK